MQILRWRCLPCALSTTKPDVSDRTQQTRDRQNLGAHDTLKIDETGPAEGGVASVREFAAVLKRRGQLETLQHEASYLQPSLAFSLHAEEMEVRGCSEMKTPLGAHM